MHVAIAGSSTRSSATLQAMRSERLAALRDAERAGAALTVTPELSLTGYPPEDLLLRPAFVDANLRELAALAAEVRDSALVVGSADRHEGRCHNAAAVLGGGKVAHVYRKQCLPNYRSTPHAFDATQHA